MLNTVRANWALLAGIGMLMLGHGLQNSLLGVRANLDGFPTAVTGLVMSGYSLGFLVSAILTPRLVRQVGHVRVFAALSAMASSAILAHAIWVEPVSWFALRIVTGVCMSGAYIVCESWLNASTGNEQRGQLLSVYMVVQLMFWASGQLLLNIGDPRGFTLFITVAILVSLAVVPLLLSPTTAPPIPTPRGFTIIDLYRVSPLGCVGMIAVGFSQGAFYSMGAVFGQNVGFSLAQISVMLAATTFAGMLCQWPIGWSSDRFDRRSVLIGVTFGTAIALLASLLVGFDNPLAFIGVFAAYGAFCLPMYSLCIAHTNDFLDPEDMVGASGALVFAIGLGNMVGPPVIGTLMQIAGNVSFILSLAICHAALGAFGLYRATRRVSLPLAEQGQHLWIPSTTPSPMVTSIAQETAVELAESEAPRR